MINQVVHLVQYNGLLQRTGFVHSSIVVLRNWQIEFCSQRTESWMANAADSTWRIKNLAVDPSTKVGPLGSRGEGTVRRLTYDILPDDSAEVTSP